MKTKLVLLLALISSVAFSQIKKVESQKSDLIGKIGALGEVWLKCEKTDNTYTFTYKDMKYQQLDEYKSFFFNDEDNAFENLYNTILEGFESQPKEDIMLELPNDIIWLHFGKTMGQPFVEFRHAVDKNADVIGVSTWMNKKKLDELFGKKKKKKKRKK